jgi:hypothetical protein
MHSDPRICQDRLSWWAQRPRLHVAACRILVTLALAGGGCALARRVRGHR